MAPNHDSFYSQILAASGSFTDKSKCQFCNFFGAQSWDDDELRRPLVAKSDLLIGKFRKRIPINLSVEMFQFYYVDCGAQASFSL